VNQRSEVAELPIEMRPAAVDDTLSFLDQAMFLAVRATDQEPVMQSVWVYDRPVDWDGVRRFHQNFGYGLLGRLIEPSPLPFGRHRWVSAIGPQRELDVDDPRPRSELSDWADERVQLPIDPEHGPGWHIGVLPMTDGSTAISVVASHCLADGIGGIVSILDAVTGDKPDFAYARPHSRPRRAAMLADARVTMRGLPELGRTIVAVGALAFRRRKEITRSAPGAAEAKAQSADSGDEYVVPAVTVHVDIADWDKRAAALSGNSYSLFAGFAAKLGERMGRKSPEDGTVSLLIPQNDRSESDTRANAALLATVKIDPAPVTSELSDARAVIRQTLKDIRSVPDEKLLFLPLIPFIPKRAVKKTAEVLLGAADLPVATSNVGDLPPVMGQLDGTDADYMFIRGMDRHVPRDVLEQRGGQLTLVSGRIVGKVSISIVAYQVGAENSKARLHDLAEATLADFGLTGVIF
jgi:hypothetical protein